MLALRMTEPAADGGKTEVVHLDPSNPGPGEVAIDVEYAGINFIDVMARRGDPGYAPSWPYIPGLEVAGTVRAVGSDVLGHRVGDRVAAFTEGGGLAGVALAPATIVVGVPDAVPLEQAAAAPLTLATAILLLRDVARLVAGQTILMHSASGGVGTAVAQVAAALGSGLRIGTVGRGDKIAEGQAAGWDTVVAREEAAADQLHAALPGGADVILDPTGTGLLDLDLELAAPGARVVLFGNAAGGAPAPLPPVSRLIGGNIALVGFSMSRFRITRPGVVAGALHRGLAMLSSGDVVLRVSVIDSLESVATTHDLLASGRGRGKYVVRIGQ